MSKQGFNKMYIWIAAAVLLGAVLFLFLKGGAVVTLSASMDKASYSSGDTMNLAVSLANAGNRETCVSDTALGNIKFLSFTKDGKTVETRTAPSYYLTSLSEMMKAKLKKLAPGENTTMVLSSSQDPGLGANAFYATAVEGTYGMSTFYNVGAPGVYEMKVVYEYPGKSSPDCPNVFKGSIKPATITFTVTK